MLKFDWLCQHSGRRNENLAHLTRCIFPSFLPPPFLPLAQHEEKYGWLARLIQILLNLESGNFRNTFAVQQHASLVLSQNLLPTHRVWAKLKHCSDYIPGEYLQIMLISSPNFVVLELTLCVSVQTGTRSRPLVLKILLQLMCR